MAEPPPPPPDPSEPLVDNEETESETEDDFGGWKVRNKRTAANSGARHDGVGTAAHREPLVDDKGKGNLKSRNAVNSGASTDTAVYLADDDDSSSGELLLQAAARVTDSDHSDGGKQSPADSFSMDREQTFEVVKVLQKNDKGSETDHSTEDDRKQAPKESKDPFGAAEERERVSLSDYDQYVGYGATSFGKEDDSGDEDGFAHSAKSTNREKSKAMTKKNDVPIQNYVFGSTMTSILPEDHSYTSDDLDEGVSKASKYRSRKLSTQMSKREYKENLEKRKTGDGCLRPLASINLNSDGTYAKPSGRNPKGMVWDDLHGLWCPLKKKQRKGASRKYPLARSKASSDEESVMEEEFSSEDEEPFSQEDDSNRMQDSVADAAVEDQNSRWTEDGYFRPRTQPRENEDGTFARPCGRGPPGLEWDPRRGMFAPTGKANKRAARRSNKRRKQSQSGARSTSNTSGSVQHGAQVGKKWNRKRKGRTEDDALPSAAHHMSQDGRAPKRPKRTVVGEPTKSRTFSALSTQMVRNAPSRRPRMNSMKPAASHSKHKSSSKALGNDFDYSSDPADIGDQVFARWEENKGYYWATIVGKKKANSRSVKDEFTYSLLFFDNDYSSSVSRDKFVTANWCRQYLPNENPDFADKEPDHDDKVREFIEQWRTRTAASAIVGAREMKLPGTFSLQELHDRRCQECHNCKKPDCGACVSCRRNETASDDEREVCVQKMCLRIPDSKKLQTAEGLLPAGWSFLFGEETPFAASKKPHIPGLFVHHPNGNKIFRSAEAVVAFVPRFLDINPNAVDEFNRHIGFIKDARPARTSKKQTRSRRLPMTLEDLLSSRCGECPNCTKEDCGRCASCLSDRRQVCIQKMCCEIPVKDKAQPMPPSSGFPAGWKYVIDETMDGYTKWNAEKSPKTVTVDGLKILPASGKLTFYSAEAAIRGKPTILADASADEFYKYIGALPGLPKEKSSKKSVKTNTKTTNRGGDTVRAALPSRELRQPQVSTGRQTARASASSFLCGRRLCLPWTDVNGTHKVVYGAVEECNENVHSNKVTSCKVVYSENTRDIANRTKNGCGTFVPESAILDPSVVIGGCTRFEEEFTGTMDRLSDYSQLPLGCKWILPEFRLEEIVDGSPRLTLIVRGYQLILEVKPSTIPNAGKGVFLSCKPCEPMTDCSGDESDDEQEPFVLEPGELVDLGVYGPLCMQDMKSKAAFYAKNFMHSFQCEEWVYGQQSEGHIDVTDDFTGELHGNAKNKVFPYVNECDDEKDIVVHQDYDPEATLHYLMGHLSQSQGQFKVQCGKQGIEVFTNYNDGYEKVRVRKGYSSLDEEEQGDLWEGSEAEDMSALLEMNAYEEEDLQDATNFLFMLFSTADESKFAEEVIERALLCAVVLHRRTQLLYCGAQGNLKRLLTMSRGLVRVLLDMANDENDAMKVLFVRGKVDGLLEKILRQNYDAEDLAKLGDMIEL